MLVTSGLSPEMWTSHKSGEGEDKLYLKTLLPSSLCLQEAHLIFILDAFNSFRVNHDWVKETIFIINIKKDKFGL